MLAWDVKYLVVGKEVGDSGTPHLQGYVNFTESRTLSALKKLNPSIHWEVTKGTPNEASDYCKKSDVDFYEVGKLPMSQKDKGQAEIDRFNRAMEAVREERYDDIPGDIMVRHLKQLEYAVARKDQVKRKLSVLEGESQHEWIYGPTGTGKTHTAFEENPGYYLKLTDGKWYDGYNHEEVIIVEEVGLKQAEHAEHYKRLLDKYPFRVETKGGSMNIRPRKVVITSNYHPREIWPGEQSLMPILRRIKIRHMTVTHVSVKDIINPVVTKLAPMFNVPIIKTD